MAGTSLADIADLLGHKDLATTQIYAKVQQQHLRNVVGRLSGVIPIDLPHGSATRHGDERNDDSKLLSNDSLGK